MIMRSIENMVRQEVIYSCSLLISELAKKPDDEYYDDILTVCSQENFRDAAEDEGWEVTSRNDGILVLMKSGFIYDPLNEVVEHLDELEDVDYADYEIEDPDDGDVWRSLCECEGIEPYKAEALEHWIVSDWLADRLKKYGEMVSTDIYGLTVWGRTCSGQAIASDYVIQRIYQDICDA